MLTVRMALAKKTRATVLKITVLRIGSRKKNGSIAAAIGSPCSSERDYIELIARESCEIYFQDFFCSQISQGTVYNKLSENNINLSAC